MACFEHIRFSNFDIFFSSTMNGLSFDTKNMYFNSSGLSTFHVSILSFSTILHNFIKINITEIEFRFFLFCFTFIFVFF